jgi:hypothetical protein
MIFRLEGIKRRRSQLIAAIDLERINLRDTTTAIRHDMVYASLGLIVGKFSSRHAWVRGVVLAALAVITSARLMNKSGSE